MPTLLRFLRAPGSPRSTRPPRYYGLGVTLGNAEVRLDELVAAYAAFARGGEWIAPTFVPRAATAAPRRDAWSRPRTAFWITDILSDPEAREYIFGRGGSLELPFPVAVKTGTSQAYHDNWTVGYSRDVTVGVWVGNFDRTPLRNSTGVTGAGADLPRRDARRRTPPRRHGAALSTDADRRRRLDGRSSARSARCRGCPRTRGARRGSASGSPPSRRSLPCSWHHQSDEGLLTFWPAEYPAVGARARPRRAAGTRGLGARPRTALGARHAVRRTRPDGGPPASAPAGDGRRRALAIVSPPDGATYSIDPTLRREFQTLPLRARRGAAARSNGACRAA